MAQTGATQRLVEASSASLLPEAVGSTAAAIFGAMVDRAVSVEGDLSDFDTQGLRDEFLAFVAAAKEAKIGENFTVPIPGSGGKEITFKSSSRLRALSSTLAAELDGLRPQWPNWLFMLFQFFSLGFYGKFNPDENETHAADEILDGLAEDHRICRRGKGGSERPATLFAASILELSCSAVAASGGNVEKNQIVIEIVQSFAKTLGSLCASESNSQVVAQYWHTAELMAVAILKGAFVHKDSNCDRKKQVADALFAYISSLPRDGTEDSLGHRVAANLRGVHGWNFLLFCFAHGDRRKIFDAVSKWSKADQRDLFTAFERSSGINFLTLALLSDDTPFLDKLYGHAKTILTADEIFRVISQLIPNNERSFKDILGEWRFDGHFNILETHSFSVANWDWLQRILKEEHRTYVSQFVAVNAPTEDGNHPRVYLTEPRPAGETGNRKSALSDRPIGAP
ncbi:MAG: hypothetical protein LBH53_03685 [Puniceicoccales bacterium]|nr:hypothetical protein [Puniceicoccales bacterium]